MAHTIPDQPIPPGMLKPEHRRFAEIVELRQPIASYEDKSNSGKDRKFIVPWPPNLTAIYQSSIFGGRYALNRAWQEIPQSAIVGFLDTIRNRILKLALDIKEELGLVSDNVDAIPATKVDQVVVNNIYGGTM